jgi:TPR repeat protein
VNTLLAFQYLQRAAEHAVDDLNNLSVNLSASKGELVMAIYELGVSFRHGWGVQKDKQTACYYFKIAAELASTYCFPPFATL